MESSMDWDDLKIFLAVARKGSLGAAAQVLDLSQPTLGRRIKGLEAELGVQLFHRDGAAGLSLTGDGATILDHVGNMEREVDALVLKLRCPTHLQGILTVASADWYNTIVLAPIFARFSEQHPRVVVELLNETREVQLARREADLVFRFLPFDEPSVIQRKVGLVEFGVYAARDYLQQHGEPTRSGLGHGLILLDGDANDLPDSPWLRARLPQAQVRLRTGSRHMQAQFCRAGRGLALLPRALGDTMEELVLLSLGEAPPARHVWAGYHLDLKSSPRLRALLDTTLESLREAEAAHPASKAA
jgi:DNA-binding transcriptional LysR family regulator